MSLVSYPAMFCDGSFQNAEQVGIRHAQSLPPEIRPQMENGTVYVRIKDKKVSLWNPLQKIEMEKKLSTKKCTRAYYALTSAVFLTSSAFFDAVHETSWANLMRGTSYIILGSLVTEWEYQKNLLNQFAQQSAAKYIIDSREPLIHPNAQAEGQINVQVNLLAAPVEVEQV